MITLFRVFFFFSYIFDPNEFVIFFPSFAIINWSWVHPGFKISFLTTYSNVIVHILHNFYSIYIFMAKGEINPTVYPHNYQIVRTQAVDKYSFSRNKTTNMRFATKDPNRR